MITFDIETAPLHRKQLEKLCPPLDESKFVVGDFDPESVKYGNTTDPEKRKAKLERSRTEHEKKQASAEADLAAAKAEHFDKFAEHAPLDAALSRVLVIGYYNPAIDKFLWHYDDVKESEILKKFWEKMLQKFGNQETVVGVNIFDFDLPYLVRRSWVNGVEVPQACVMDLHTKWPKYHPKFVDLRRYWLAGAHPGGTKSSFATLAAAFGTEGKPDDGVTGKNLHEQWKTNPDAARAYLESDCRQPAIWAKKMGVK